MASKPVKALISDWEKVGPVIMIAAGVGLVLVGLIVRKRHRGSAEAQEKEKWPSNSPAVLGWVETRASNSKRMPHLNRHTLDGVKVFSLSELLIHHVKN